MTNHPIFEKFVRQKSVSSGRHVYDFLGGMTAVKYKKGWERHVISVGKEVGPSYPPLNEHYFDWIALLQSVDQAFGTYRMAELGAGWAPWLVSAAMASRQRAQISKIELLAVEADPTHYGWVREHFQENGLDPDCFQLLHGAVSSTPGYLKFPAIENPDENYGASSRLVRADTPFIEVPTFSIVEVLSRFSAPLDFLHIDIQGAEYEAIPPAMYSLRGMVKSIMIGTHISDSLHAELAALFEGAGWRTLYNFKRNSTTVTEYGEVTFEDGFIYFKNTAL